MQIKDIYIYPIKSLGGIRVESAKVLEKGFVHDRRWMLVDKNGDFMTQRKTSHMVLLQTDLTTEGVKVFHKHHPKESMLLPFSAEKADRKVVRVWEDEVNAFTFGGEVNQWFSEMLGLKCELVHMTEQTDRKFGEKYRDQIEQVSFADAMPFLIIGQSSLDDLNSRLSTPVGMERFRPNLVFSEASPFLEDHWKEISIGGITFRVTKPCARCVVTTVDPSNGQKGKEPLRTLATYRNNDKKVLFGQNLVAYEKGEVKVGDRLSVLN
ncbi:MOSC domain-containing protein [Pleomorphovibrio marinus]|uniref:MOSC domain-containing protein n=1 Tax=Pleomorphovibrio marinus TaxID=2164132 RepID=UPI000E0BC2CA|nr:MOSC N-terminal beta barrel domain-containing protein [Pleomorphovibrio marinus]